MFDITQTAVCAPGNDILNPGLPHCMIPDLSHPLILNYIKAS